MLWKIGLVMGACNLAGGYLGARTAVEKGAKFVRAFFILVVLGAYVVLQPELGEETLLRFAGRRHLAAAMAVGAVIGFYDGALGPGTGSFLVFALVGLLMGVCNLAGGYLGARTAVEKGAKFVRVFFIVVVSAFIVRIGGDVFGVW